MSDFVNHLPSGRLAFSVDEFAAASGLGRVTLYEAIKKQRLLARKCGTRTLILRDDAIAFLQNLPRLKPSQKERPAAKIMGSAMVTS